MTITYIEAIFIGFPDCKVHSLPDTDGSVYTDIIWDSGPAIPSQAILDTWIIANPGASEDKRITVLALRNRFTAAEKASVTFFMSLINDPAQAIQNRAAAAYLVANVTDALASTWIDLNRLDTQIGIGGLTSFPDPLNPGNMILTQQRATEILTNPIQQEERPHFF